jgi:phage recombination protein Bet
MNSLIKTDGIPAIAFTKEQVALIRSQIAPKATPDELSLFLHQCKRTGLDPFARQIYAIHRKSGGQDKMTIQTSIDGFRVIAERSGDYGGQDEPVFTYKPDGSIESAKVTVYRFHGQNRYPAAVGVAFWDEYCQRDYAGNPTAMYAKMPRVMLSKVAEALALRKAYPQDLSGLYTTEEMNQADGVDRPHEDELQMLRDMVYNSTLTDEERDRAFEMINGCADYKLFQKILYRLEQVQIDHDTAINPNQKDIAKKVKQEVEKENT